MGTLVVRGTYSEGFTFHHADGSAYGAPAVSPERSRVLARVLEALVGMGFEQRDAQAMIDRAAPHVGSDATLDAAMRAALRQAVLPSGVGSLREQGAEYRPLAA
ncbi:MAG: RuvA C-terminal domain-containing protein [Sandaracinaceae bacterium]|nr:RuvA C-terminal domain-containing protein [Sandaracinaceae bacterium]